MLMLRNQEYRLKVRYPFQVGYGYGLGEMFPNAIIRWPSDPEAVYD